MVPLPISVPSAQGTRTIDETLYSRQHLHRNEIQFCDSRSQTISSSLLEISFSHPQALKDKAYACLSLGKLLCSLHMRKHKNRLA